MDIRISFSSYNSMSRVLVTPTHGIEITVGREQRQGGIIGNQV
jgi:hypothetical protein